MTAREKVLNIEQQVVAITTGEVGPTGPVKQITCPFCGLVTIYGQVLCCYECATVVEAVLDHIDFKDSMERTERVMNRLLDAQAHAVLS